MPGYKFSEIDYSLVRQYVTELVARSYNDESENVDLVLYSHDLMV